MGRLVPNTGATLIALPDRLEFRVREQRFATYTPGGSTFMGWGPLSIADGRALTDPDPTTGLSLWRGHGNLNGLAFTPSPQASPPGQIVSTDLTVRRGSYSVGFRQTCAWCDLNEQPLLEEEQIVRVAPGPCEGAILDWTLRLHVAETPLLLGRTEEALLHLRLASPLRPQGGGQIRSSAGQYGPEAIHGRSAAWCACVGVVRGETVGLVLLSHPDNPDYPPLWQADSEGVLSPSPFLWQTLPLSPRSVLTLRYRLLVHRGYVDAGWATARLADFAQIS